MAISRVKTWANGEVLSHTDLNAEFDNIINNALSLISPLTSNLAAGSNRITGLGAATANTDAARFSQVGLVALSAGSASGATLDFTSSVITSTYDNYVLVLTDFRPATDNVDLYIRISQAAAFLSGVADYNWHRMQSVGAGLVEVVDISDSEIEIANSIRNDDQNTSATLWFSGLATNGLFKALRHHTTWVSASDLPAQSVGTGALITTSAPVDGIRVFFSSGNITSGEYVLFGVRKTIT